MRPGEIRSLTQETFDRETWAASSSLVPLAAKSVG